MIGVRFNEDPFFPDCQARSELRSSSNGPFIEIWIAYSYAVIRSRNDIENNRKTGENKYSTTRATIKSLKTKEVHENKHEQT